ncbi:MAG: hypothetical protein HYZ53_28660 [Planctomycetes bacterium]|nr:hypothetical protein [Planctomycetota bacterium]
MAKAKGLGTRTCKFCGKSFKSRNKLHVYCSRETCRQERRLDYMRAYMPKWKEKYPGYWKSEKQREYLKKWRETHPRYFKDWRNKQKRKQKKA